MYEVRIDQFEGPMDLLLYLVQQNELDPGSISIAPITDQYLAYLEKLPRADLSAAGDFLLLAARLMSLKARELLPREERDEVEQIELDADREELIRQMLEYQQFKEASGSLKQLEEGNFHSFYRGRMESPRKDEDEEIHEESGVFQLYQAFLDSLKTSVQENVHTIEVDDVTIEDRQQAVDNQLRIRGKALFEDLLGRDQRRITAVVTFMALLEMIKLDQVVLRQATPLGALWIYRKKENPEFAREISSSFTPLTPDTSVKDGLAAKLREWDKGRKAVSGLHDILREVSERVRVGERVSDSHLVALLEGQNPEEVFAVPTEPEEPAD